ncbi:MAG TPA: ATP-binding protein [Candidatus Limnocylindria bacterium]|nr:ATP-binding protein [Candidatus Limnocylindria bacterium]
MGWLAELFETNRIIVLSVYGQVFFVMGLAVALQQRGRSQLSLARSLGWLAGFGIVHGLMEWGYLFVPIQAGFLPQPIIEGLLLLQLAMKPVSFALLFQFGVELVLATREANEWPRLFGQPWLRIVPSGAVVLWVVSTLAISGAAAAGFVPEPRPWLRSEEFLPALADVGAPLAVGDVAARWLIALPGSLVVAYGLYRTSHLLAPVGGARVAGALRAATVAFAAYALLAGVVTLPAPFPPASAINDSVVLATLGVPIEVFRSLAGLAIAIAVVRSLELFEIETDRILAEARRRDLLLRERERIGRDLHDGVIQSIYAAGLHLEQATTDLGPEARDRVRTVMEELNRITGDIRSTIFDLRSGELEARDAEAIVLAVADELQAHTLVELEIGSEGLFRPRLRPEQADELRHLVTETFSNILRHARASRVSVRMICTRRRFRLEISDDGVGFDPSVPPAPSRGRRGTAQGLANIRRRAELLSADLDIESEPGQGTRLSLTMPVATVRRPS